MKKVICFILTIAFCVCAMTGCGKKDSDLTGQPVDYKEGGTGVISLPITHFDTFNPVLTQSDTVLDALQLVYDGLYRYGSDGQVMPVLATGADISADGLVYTLHLRKDVKWHDGSSFSAADVEYTISAIENAEQTKLGRYLSGIAAHSVVDAYTYRIELSVPNSYFTQQLVFPIVKSGTDCTQVQSGYIPIGTSAYAYVPATMNRAYVFHKNAACVTAPLGMVEEVIFKEIPEAANLMYALESREIEAVHVDTAQLRTYSPKGNVHTVTYTNRNLTFLGICAEGSLADKHVRRALSLFLDRETLKKNAMFERFAPVYLPLADQRYYNQDTTEARKTEAESLLQAAGFAKNGDGIWERATEEGKTTLAVSVLVNQDNAVRVAAAEEIVKQLRSCGVQARVEQTDYETYISRIENFEYSLFLGETVMEDDLDASAFTGSTARYSTALIENADGLLYNLRVATTPATKESALQTLASALADEMPVIALGFGQNAVIVNDRISGDILPICGNIYTNFSAWNAQ